MSFLGLVLYLLPTPFELTDFRMSAELRIELTNLKDRLLSFGVLSFTWMTKPAIEFNMKLANVVSNVDLVVYVPVSLFNRSFKIFYATWHHILNVR